MGFATATDTSDAAPSTTLLNAIETLLTANSAWSLVETVVSGTFTCRVWKCSGSVNSFGSDWFLVLRRTTASLGTSTITATACESYDSVGHLMTRWMQATTATATPDATLNSVTGATTIAPGSATPFAATITTSATTFTYWILVTKNELIVRSSVDATAFYVGLFTPFFTADWPTKEFPLVCTGLGNASSLGTTTRCPGTTTSTGSASRVDVSLGAGLILDLANATGVIGTVAGTNPDILNGKPRGRRIGVFRFYSGLSHGVYNDVLFFSVAAGVALGDTITIGANTWVAVWVLASSSAFFVNQAAV